MVWCVSDSVTDKDSWATSCWRASESVWSVPQKVPLDHKEGEAFILVPHCVWILTPRPSHWFPTCPGYFRGARTRPQTPKRKDPSSWEEKLSVRWTKYSCESSASCECWLPMDCGDCGVSGRLLWWAVAGHKYPHVNWLWSCVHKHGNDIEGSVYIFYPVSWRRG